MHILPQKALLLILHVLTVHASASTCSLHSAASLLQVREAQSVSSVSKHAAGIADAIARAARQKFRPALAQEDPVKEETEELEPVPGHWYAVAGIIFLLLAALSPVLVVDGFLPFATCVFYLASLSLTPILVKAVTNEGFAFPATIAVFHMLGTCIATALFQKPVLSHAIPAIPLAAVYCLSLLTSNTSLLYSTATFAAMLGSSTPAVVFLLELALGRRKEIELKTLLALNLVVLGCVLCVNGDVQFDMYGLLLLLAANACRAMKSIWQYDVLANMPPQQLTFWMCFWTLATLLPVAAMQEGLQVVRSIDRVPVVAFQCLLMSVVSATMVNILQSYAVKLFGPLMQSIVGNMNIILVTLIGVAFLHEHVTDIQYVGTVLTSGGVVLLKAKLDSFPLQATIWKRPDLEAAEETAEDETAEYAKAS